MVVFVGIAVLCLGAVIARYLRDREKKCQPGPGEPGPDTLKITVSYCPPPDVPRSHATQIGKQVIQTLHDKYGNKPDIQKWRIQLIVLDAICYSGHLKEDSTDDAVVDCPSITVTFQSMSVLGHCFPCSYFDPDFLTIINKQFTDDSENPIKTFVLTEPLKSNSPRTQLWHPPESATE